MFISLIKQIWRKMFVDQLFSPRLRRDDNKVNKRKLWLYQHVISLRNKRLKCIDFIYFFLCYEKPLYLPQKKKKNRKCYCGLLYTPLLRKQLPDIKSSNPASERRCYFKQFNSRLFVQQFLTIQSLQSSFTGNYISTIDLYIVET